MCGRYFLNISLDQLVNRYNIKDIPDELMKYSSEIFPSNFAPVIFNNGKDNSIKYMNWGFRTSYSNNLIINARSETVHKKKLFKVPFHKNRCIIPANGFYEWKDNQGKKEKHFIKFKEEDIISIAGIYDQFEIKGEKTLSFCILTKDAPEKLMDIHDRVPVILEKNEESFWLKKVFTPKLFDVFNKRDFEFEIKKQ